MILTVNKYVNARNAPNTASENPFYLNPNDEIDLVDVVIGELHDGSAVWYVGKDGRYFWSGGVSTVDFSLAGKRFDILSISEQQQILREATPRIMQYCQNELPHFVDLKITCHTAGTNTTCGLVAAFTKNPGIDWSKFEFKGFNIPISLQVDQNPKRPGIDADFEQLNSAHKTRILDEAMQNCMDIWATTFSNLISVRKGFKSTGGQNTGKQALQFQVQKKDRDQKIKMPVPDFIVYTSDDGNIYKIPTDIETAGENRAQGYTPGKSKVLLRSGFRPGCSIGREIAGDAGTLGLKVQRTSGGTTKYFILSCYHVLCSYEVSQKIFEFKNSTSNDFTIVAPSKFDRGGEKIAVVKEGKLTDSIDAAIAQLDEPNKVHPMIYEMGNAPSPIRTLNRSDEKVCKIKVTGKNSNFQRGIVLERSTFTFINYGLANPHRINGVIMTTKISVPGDSGACVVDEDGRVIGLVVSSNDDFSYLIPIGRIIHPENLNVSICYV